MLDKNNRFNYGVDSGSGNAQNLSNLQNAYPSSHHSWLSMGVKGAVLGLGLATLLPLTAFAESSESPGRVAYSDYPGPEGYQWQWPAAPTVGGDYLNTVDVKWNPVQPIPAVIPPEEIQPPEGIHLTYGTPINDDLVLEGQIEVYDKGGSIIVDKDHPGTGKFQFVVERVLYPIGGPYNIFAYYFIDPDNSELKTDDYDGCQHQYLYVDPAQPELEWDTPKAITYGTPLSDVQLNAKCITIDVSTIGTSEGGPNGKILEGTFTYEPAAGTILDVGTHKLKVTFVPSNPNYLNAYAEVDLVVNKADLGDQFKWGDPILDTLTYGDRFTEDNIHYTTTVPGTLTVEPNLLGEVLDAGSYPLKLTFTPDSPNYKAETKPATLIVNKAIPLIIWDVPARLEKGKQIAISARAEGIIRADGDGSREDVTGDFTYDPSLPVTLDQVPEQTLTATFTPTGASAVNYKSVSVTRTVEVFTRIPVYLTWATPDPIVYGTPLDVAMEMDQRGIKVDGIQLNALAATADGTPVDGRYVYIPEEGNVLPAGTNQMLKVTFTPTEDTIYETIYTTEPGLKYDYVLIDVLKAKPIVTWEPESPITYGTPLGDAQLNAEFTWEIAGQKVVVDGTPVYDPDFGTVLPVGTHELTVTFTPTDTDNYEVVTATATVVVEQEKPNIDWGIKGKLPDIVYGTALKLGEQLNAVAKDSTGAEIPGTYTYDPAEGTILNAGNNQKIKVTFIPESKNYKKISKTVTINVLKATPIINWEPASPITYGTALSDEHLNATFTWNVDGQGTVTVEGTATYQPVLGTILSAGTQTLTLVSFIPSGDTYRPEHPENYNPIDAETTIAVERERPIEVKRAVLTITADDKFVEFNEPAPNYTYTITGFVNGEDESVLTNPVIITCKYEPGPEKGKVGVYPIIPSNATADNYDIRFVNGELSVGVKEPDIIWEKPDPITTGTPLVLYRTPNERGELVPGVQLNALAVEDKNVPKENRVEITGKYDYDPVEGTTFKTPGEKILTVTFTPDEIYAGNYKAATAVVVLLVRDKLTINWDDPQRITYGEPMGTLFNATVTTEEGKDVSTLGNFRYTWTQSGNVIKPTAHTPLPKENPEKDPYVDWLQVEFILNDAITEYAQPDPVIVDLIVDKATPVIAWNPEQKGPNEDPDGKNPCPPTLARPVPPVYQLPDISYGTELTDADQLNAFVLEPANITGTMIYTVEATKLTAGWHNLFVTFNPDPAYADKYESVTVANLIYVKYAEYEVIWEDPADIIYGTPLSDAQYSDLMYGLVGTNRVDGTADNQNPALGVILPAGVHTLEATFVPNDPNYNRVKGLTQKLTVKPAIPEVIIGDPTNPDEIIEIDYGTLIDPTDQKINAFAIGYDSNELEGDFMFEAYEYDPATGNYVLIDKDPTREYLDVLALDVLPEDNPQYMLRAIFTPTGDEAGNYEETYVEKGLNVLPVAVTVKVAKKIDPIPYGKGFTRDFLLSVTTVRGVKTEDGTGYETVEGADGTPEFFIDDIPFENVDTKTLASGTHSLRAVFTPAAEETNYKVGKGKGIIDIYGDLIPEWVIDTPITYGTPLTDAYFQAVFKDAETGDVVAGNSEYSIIFPDGSEIPGQAGVVLEVGTYQLKVEFTPNDTDRYKNAPYTATRELVVTGKNPNAVWFPLAMFYGQTPGDNQYNAKAIVSGSFDYPEFPTDAGSYPLNAPFTPENPNYATVDVWATPAFVILKAPIRFEWPAEDMNYGDTPTDAKQFNAKAISVVTGEEVEGTFDYPRNEMPTMIGIYTLVAPWTPKDTRNYERGIAYANIEIFGADPTDQLTWKPAPLAYGKKAGAAQKNATSGTIAGHFEYPNMDGYNVGEYQVTANFISEDPNYANSEVTATLKVTQAAPTIKFYKAVPAEEGGDPTYEEIDEVTMTYGQILKLNDDNTITITTEEDEETEVESASEFLTNAAISENNKEGEEEEESESEDMTIKVFVTGVDDKDVDGTVTFTLDGVKLAKLEQPLEPKVDPYKLTAKFTSENDNYASGKASVDVIVEVEEGSVDVDWEVRDFYPWSEGLVWGDFAWKDAVAWNAYTSETLAYDDQLTYKYAEVDPDLVPSEDIDEMTLEEALKALNLTLEDLCEFKESNPVDAGTYFLVAWYDDPTYGYGEDKDIIEIFAAKPELEVTNTMFTYGTTLYPESFGIYAYGTDDEPINGEVIIYLDGTLIGNEGITPEIGTYTLTVYFTPDSTNYTPAETTVAVTVRPSGDIIKVLWDVPEVITYGDVIEQNAAAINTVDGEVLAEGDELVYIINEEGVILPEGIVLDAGTYRVMAIFLGGGEYEGIEKDTGWLPVTVEPVEPTLSWNPAPLTYGTAATAAQENATANVVGQFTYPDMSKLTVGKHEVIAKFISGDPNYADSEVSAILEVTKATPVIRWATPAPITYGTPLSDEQLNATANVDGTFVYTPAAGTELEIGTYTLFAEFTPKDTANYTKATASVELTVTPSVEVEITWEPKSPITYGTVLSVEQLNATANVEGHFYYNPSYGFVVTPESQFVVNGKLRLSVIFIPTDRKHFKNAYKEVFIDIVTDEDEDDEDTTDDGDDAPALTISKAGSAKGLVNAAADALVITFTGTLEESTDGVTWTPVADAKDGTYVVDVKVASKKFYRSVK